MKALWAWAVLLVAASTLSATEYSYSNSGGTVSQTSTTLTISGATLGSPAGTVTMSCELNSILPSYGFTSEWTCTGGSLTLQSTDGRTSLSGVFTNGVFTLIQSEKNRVYYYNYTLYANFSASQKINGKTIGAAGAVMETLPTMTSPLNPTTGTIQSGLIDTSQQYEPL